MTFLVPPLFLSNGDPTLTDSENHIIANFPHLGLIKANLMMPFSLQAD